MDKLKFQDLVNYQFEHVIASRPIEHGVVYLTAVCVVGANTIDFVVTALGVPVGRRRTLLEAVQLFNRYLCGYGRLDENGFWQYPLY